MRTKRFPLAALVHKKPQEGQLQTFDQFPDDQRAALDTLQARLVEASVLVRPRWNRYTVDTDEWDRENVFVLLQKLLGGTDRLARYWSCWLIDAKRP